jgi:hypothetical protein
VGEDTCRASRRRLCQEPGEGRRLLLGVRRRDPGRGRLSVGAAEARERTFPRRGEALRIDPRIRERKRGEAGRERGRTGGPPSRRRVLRLCGFHDHGPQPGDAGPRCRARAPAMARPDTVRGAGALGRHPADHDGAHARHDLDLQLHARQPADTGLPHGGGRTCS